MTLEKIIIGGSLGPGFVHGFCDGYQIPMSNLAHNFLSFAPMIGLGGFAGTVAYKACHHAEQKAVGVPFYGGMGLIGGGILTLAGYGVGYLAGTLTKV